MISNKKLIFLFGILLISFSIVWMSSSTLAKNNTNIPLSNINHLKLSSSEEWIRTWGLNGSDYGYAVAIDSSGDVYLGGDIEIGGSSNASLIKYNSLGEYQWDITWGGVASESISSIYIDSSDDIYITGKARSFGISDDIFLVKYDTLGNLIWNRTWGDSTENDFGSDLFVDEQGNIFIAGFTSGFGVVGQDFLFLKYNNTGDFQWYKTWGGDGNDRAKAIDFDSEGNIFIMGETTSFGFGNSELGLLCYDTSGTLKWNTTWGSSTLDRPQDMVIDSNNNIYVSGFTYHPDIGTGDNNFFVVKLDNSGIPLWGKIWGSSYMDLGVGIALDSSENLFFMGYTEGFEAGIQDIYLAKFDSDGDNEWETIWDSGDYDYAHDFIIEQSTNDIYVAGESNGFTIEKDLQMILIKNPVGSINNNQTESAFIPGYNLFIFFGILGFISILIILKLRTTKK